MSETCFYCGGWWETRYDITDAVADEGCHTPGCPNHILPVDRLAAIELANRLVKLAFETAGAGWALEPGYPGFAAQALQDFSENEWREAMEAERQAWCARGAGVLAPAGPAVRPGKEGKDDRLFRY